MDRFINLKVECGFCRLGMRGSYLVALRSLVIFIVDSKPTVSSSGQIQGQLQTKYGLEGENHQKSEKEMEKFCIQRAIGY